MARIHTIVIRLMSGCVSVHTLPPFDFMGCVLHSDPSTASNAAPSPSTVSPIEQVYKQHTRRMLLSFEGTGVLLVLLVAARVAEALRRYWLIRLLS